MQNKEQEPAIIKKYPNRRLYDTETSSYITLDDLCERVKKGQPFIVVDAKSGQDLTRLILTQIIFEQETKGLQLLPTEFLRSVIRFYDDSMQDVMQSYLNASMKSFLDNQERMRGMMGSFSPLNQLEEATRQNMALFEKTMQMFNPFSTMFAGHAEADEAHEKKKR